jgi:uncharacterized protein YbjT (DUF2867 family)
MKIVVTGGSGLTGHKLVAKSREVGHEVVPDAPVDGIVEIAGPEQFRLDELIRRVLDARRDQIHVVADPEARYFGGRFDSQTLVPDGDAELGAIRFEDWLDQSSNRATGIIAASGRIQGSWV